LGKRLFVRIDIERKRFFVRRAVFFIATQTGTERRAAAALGACAVKAPIREKTANRSAQIQSFAGALDAPAHWRDVFRHQLTCAEELSPAHRSQHQSSASLRLHLEIF